MDAQNLAHAHPDSVISTFVEGYSVEHLAVASTYFDIHSHTHGRGKILQWQL